jgi:hypothetical protein
MSAIRSVCCSLADEVEATQIGLEQGVWSGRPDDQDGSPDTELGISRDFVGPDSVLLFGGRSHRRGPIGETRVPTSLRKMTGISWTNRSTLRERASPSNASWGVVFNQLREVRSSSPSTQAARMWLDSWAIGWATARNLNLGSERLDRLLHREHCSRKRCDPVAGPG